MCSWFFPVTEAERDRVMIEAIKLKLRRFIADHTGLCPPPEQADLWLQAMRELEAEIERGQRER